MGTAEIGGEAELVETVIDTGFTRALCLLPDLVRSLSLPLVAGAWPRSLAAPSRAAALGRGWSGTAGSGRCRCSPRRADR